MAWVGVLQGGLTVSTAVQLHPKAQPADGVPVQGDEAQEAGSEGVGELVEGDTVSVRVPHKPLQIQERAG